jgi:hypothetical protein
VNNELERICKEIIMVLSKQISKYSVELHALQQIYRDEMLKQTQGYKHGGKYPGCQKKSWIDQQHMKS